MPSAAQCCVLALALLAAHASPSPSRAAHDAWHRLIAAAHASPSPSRAAHDAWHRLIAEYTRAAAGAGAPGDHGHSGDTGHSGDRGHSGGWGFPFALGVSPVLLLPIPFPAPAQPPANTCDACAERGDSDVPDSFVRSAAASAGAPYRQPAAPARRPAEPFRPPAEPTNYPTESAYRAELGFDYEPAPYDLPQIEPVSSATLIELYRAQTPRAPHLPPALLQPQYRPPPAAARADSAGYSYPVPAGERFTRQLSPAAPDEPGAPAAPPRYPDSLMVKGALTAYKADYTEPYTAWWDGARDASRVDFHGGSASAYRARLPSGDVQHVLMRVRRGADGASERRCMMAAAPAQAADRGPPALPDLGGLVFGGFKRMPSGQRAELWRRSERAAAGDEQRTRRHELTLMRRPDDTAVPVRYAVTTDSSMLGEESDHFEHQYTEVQPGDIPAEMLAVDVESACSDVVAMNASEPMQMSLLDPLREFVKPVSDALHLDVFNKFTKDFARKYKDKAEEVLRMNVVAQSWRWLQAFSRQGATFEVGVNFLADRLEAELAALRGVVEAAERLPAELFPHAPDQAARLAAELPARFDWRDRGAVTPPRYQGSCSSCWAFAVTAATEGALHAATGRLVPLAEQVLVDCGNRTGAHGCGGTWPSFAYDYVQETGLPALNDYTPYAEKVLKCRDAEVPIVTRISAHVNVTSNSIPALKVAIRRHAPSVVIIDATTKSFIFYKKGILYDDRCGKARGQLNHAVTAVGWGTSGGAAHFTVKNSWSDKWGEGGFARLQAPANTCGVLALPSYPRLEPGDARGGAAKDAGGGAASGAGGGAPGDAQGAVPDAAPPRDDDQ